MYTDGSAFKATVKAGYGVYIIHPNKTCEKLQGACGEICSNYEAEVIAIKTALEHLHQIFQEQPSAAKDMVIFSDSRSALQALQSESVDKTVVDTKITVDKMITAYGIRVVLQWIPGHTNIDGNEIADKLSKIGAQQEQPLKPTPYNTAKQMINNNYKEEWMNMWATGQKGRAVYQQMNKVNKKDALHSLTRKEQTAIFRLRTQHVPLNFHLNRINPQHIPTCPLCPTPLETTEHFLFDCPGLHDLRQQFLPPSPSISNCLYCNKEQLSKTSTYYFMALSRRANAQVQLG